MPTKRPTLISVFGILLIVFGSILVVTNLCCGIPGIFAGKIFSQIQLPQGQGKAPMENPLGEIDSIPGMMAYQVAGIGMNLLLGSLLLAAGIAFMKMKQAGRFLGIGYAIVGLCWAAVASFVQVTYINPRMVEINKKIQAQMGQSNPMASLSTNPTLAAIMTAFGLIWAFGLPITVLVIMLLPPVKHGLAGMTDPAWEPGPEGPDDRATWDETIRQ